MIYFIRAGAAGPVKIGFAKNTADRLRDLQGSHYETLTLIRETEGYRHQEAWFHRYFADRRVQNEWFTYCPEMMTATPAGALGELAKWMDSGPISSYDVALKLNIDHIRFLKIRRGDQGPTPAIMSALEAASAGLVPAALWAAA